MASSSLHGLFDIHSTSAPEAGSIVHTPPPTHQTSKAGARQKPSVLELDELTFGTPSKNGPSSRASNPQRQASVTSQDDNARTPNELELSRPASPTNAGSVNMIQSWNNPPINKWRVLSCCLCYFVNGMNDSGTFFTPISVSLFFLSPSSLPVLFSPFYHCYILHQSSI